MPVALIRLYFGVSRGCSVWECRAIHPCSNTETKGNINLQSHSLKIYAFQLRYATS